MARLNGHFAGNVIGRISITQGTYRKNPVSGVFNLIQEPKQGKNGAFVTIEGNDSRVVTDNNPFPGRKVRVTLPAVDQGYEILERFDKEDNTVKVEDLDSKVSDLVDFVQSQQVRLVPLKDYAQELGMSKDALRRRIDRGTIDVETRKDENGVRCAVVR